MQKHPYLFALRTASFLIIRVMLAVLMWLLHEDPAMLAVLMWLLPDGVRHPGGVDVLSPRQCLPFEQG
jgi:hypothetical protein